MSTRRAKALPALVMPPRRTEHLRVRAAQQRQRDEGNQTGSEPSWTGGEGDGPGRTDQCDEGSDERLRQQRAEPLELPAVRERSRARLVQELPEREQVGDRDRRQGGAQDGCVEGAVAAHGLTVQRATTQSGAVAGGAPARTSQVR